MDRAPVSDLCERYKAGARRVVQWLAGAAGLDKKTTSAAAMSRVALTTQEIKQLADQLARLADQKGEAPVGLDVTILVLENVIANRAECATWYEQKTPESSRDDEFDKTHKGHQHDLLLMRYILGVFKQVRDKFSRVVGISQDVFANIYQSPVLEKPSSDNATSATEPANVSAAVAPHRVEFELEAMDGDKEFALCCLLRQCNDIREHMRSLWRRYYEGKVSLRIASELTDRAFVINQHAVFVHVSDFPDLVDFEMLADYLKISAKIQGQTIESFQYKIAKAGPEVSQAAELLCIPAFLSLKMLKENEAQLKETAALREGTIDVEDWLYNTHELTRRVKEFLMSRTTVDRDLASDFIELFGADMFLATVLTTVEAKSTAIHTVVFYQIYMDIVDITQHVTLSSGIAMALARGFSDHRISCFENAIPKLGRAYRKKFLRSSVRDDCRKRSIISEKVFDEEDESPLADSFCMIFPVHAGTITSIFTMNLYRDGVLACDEDSIVMSVAALYKACRNSHLLRKAWKDMDFIIDVLGLQALGLREASDSRTPLLAAAKHYGLALGVSAQTYSKERLAMRHITPRIPLPTANKIDGRRVRIQPSSLMLTYAQKIRSGTAAGLSQEKAMDAGLHQTVAELVDDPRSGVDEKLAKRWRACGKLTSSEVLTVLEDQFQREEPGLLFDYHSFFVECAGTLAVMRSMPMKIPHGLELPSLDERLPVGYTIPQMIDEILWEAAEVERQGGGLRAYHSAVLSVAFYKFAKDIGKRGGDNLEKAMRVQKMQCCDAKTQTRKSSKPESRESRAQRIARGASMAMAGARVDFTGATLTAVEKARKVALQDLAEVAIRREDAGMDSKTARNLLGEEFTAVEDIMQEAESRTAVA